MKNIPLMIKTALIFILINAIGWLVLGVLVATGVHTGLPDDATLKLIMMLGLFGGAIILMLLFQLLRMRKRLAYFITLVVLALIMLLTLFDQVGLADAVVLVITLVPFVLLILGRKWFLQQPQT
jgi:lysylphosphatidylglycerol synthetase-like protein (DUF2156 family)